jgi:hypothetical protein
VARLDRDPDRHPDPSADHLGFLCLASVVGDHSFSSEIRAQAAALTEFLALQAGWCVATDLSFKHPSA